MSLYHDFITFCIRGAKFNSELSIKRLGTCFVENILQSIVSIMISIFCKFQCIYCIDMTFHPNKNGKKIDKKY